MKHMVFALLLGMMFTGFAAAGEQDFTIVNNTGKAFARMYISPSPLGDWGADLLAAKPLAVGSERDILVSREENAEVWDLMVLTPDGAPVKWQGLRLNDFSKISLAIENGQPIASFE